MSNKDDDMEEVLEEGRKDYPSEGQRSPTINSLVDDMGDDFNALGRSAAQAGTLNAHDEIVGGTKAVGKTIYDYAMKYLADGGEPEGLVNSYKRFRNQERDLDKEAKQKSPLAYDVGQAAAAALPGSSAKSLALLGGGSALGASESDTVAGDLANGVAGSIIGGTIGKLGERLNTPESPIVATGKGQTERVARPVIPETSPQVQPKGELNIHDDVMEHENKAKEVADRVKAFRARQLAGNNVINKSDKLAEEMYGLKLGESPYSNKVDDITIPKDNRKLFGVGEAEYNPSKPVTDQDRMLWGESPIPKHDKLPSFDEPEVKSSIKSSPQEAMNVAQTMQSNPELLGPYGKILTEAAKKGLNSFLTTNYVLSQRDQQYRKLLKDLQSNPVDGDNVDE